MKKFLVVLALAVFLFSSTAVSAEKVPAECFINYAVWAGPYCEVFILCFVFHACSTTPDPELTPEPMGDADGVSGKPKRAIYIERGDSDGAGG